MLGKDDWRSVPMRPGEPSVMTSGKTWMPMLLAESSDIPDSVSLNAP